MRVEEPAWVAPDVEPSGRAVMTGEVPSVIDLPALEAAAAGAGDHDEPVTELDDTAVGAMRRAIAAARGTFGTRRSLAEAIGDPEQAPPR